ncbi:MAG: hypothetical protein ACYDEG_01565 [bacterium]
MASRTNQATNIGQMQASQLQCIGAATLYTDYAGNISSGSPVTYTVTQTANNNSFNSNNSPSSGGSCSMPAPIQGINDNYTVNVYLSLPNPNNSAIIGAKIEIYWNNEANEITLNSIII